ncbi:hypothetical protein [Nocardioides limicola]|uniref:hypothetical protein n=1 Tax=Nocardioides limicola TaxID=2803368 RepID=UPI00193B1AE5|nr:hypothetical protein [Nocardioides sp. DJM-14]
MSRKTGELRRRHTFAEQVLGARHLREGDAGLQRHPSFGGHLLRALTSEKINVDHADHPDSRSGKTSGEVLVEGRRDPARPDPWIARGTTHRCGSGRPHLTAVGDHNSA